MENYTYRWKQAKLTPHELKILKQVIKFKHNKEIKYETIDPATIAKSIIPYIGTEQSLTFDDLRIAMVLYHKIKGPGGLPKHYGGSD